MPTKETDKTSRPRLLYAAATKQHLDRFHRPYIEALEKDYEVLTMADGDGVDLPVPIRRSVFSPSNLRAVWQIRKLLKKHQFEAAILNTSLASFLIRVAMLGMKKRPRVFNFVHGYLFPSPPKGIKARLLLLCEQITKGRTDEIAVMNQDDQRIAEDYHLCRGRVTMTHGVGFRAPASLPARDETLRRELADDDELLIGYVGLLGGTKNQIFLVQAIERLRERGIPARLVLVGDGVHRPMLEKEIKERGLGAYVTLAGNQEPAWRYLAVTDLYASASLKEGLPVNIMEAMLCGLPILAADVKGQRDLLAEREGSLFPPNDMDAFCSRVEAIRREGWLGMGAVCYPEVARYSFENAFSETLSVMRDFLEKTKGSEGK